MRPADASRVLGELGALTLWSAARLAAAPPLPVASVPVEHERCSDDCDGQPVGPVGHRRPSTCLRFKLNCPESRSLMSAALAAQDATTAKSPVPTGKYSYNRRNDSVNRCACKAAQKASFLISVRFIQLPPCRAVAQERSSEQSAHRLAVPSSLRCCGIGMSYDRRTADSDMRSHCAFARTHACWLVVRSVLSPLHASQAYVSIPYAWTLPMWQRGTDRVQTSQSNCVHVVGSSQSSVCVITAAPRPERPWRAA